MLKSLIRCRVQIGLIKNPCLVFVKINEKKAHGQRTSRSFNENQPMHRKRNFQKTFCNRM